MPRGDRTGPRGLGKMTGRGAGYCAGNNFAGFEEGRGFERGFGYGRGNGGGFGRGFHRGFGGGFQRTEPFSSEIQKSNIEVQIQRLQEELNFLTTQLKKTDNQSEE